MHDYELSSPLAQLDRTPGEMLKEECSKTTLTQPYDRDIDAITSSLKGAGWHGRRVLSHRFLDDTFVKLDIEKTQISARGYRDGVAVPFGQLSLVAQSEVRYVLGLFQH